MASVARRMRGGKLVGWDARWRDEAGRQHKKLFPRKVDAERHAAAVTTDLARGTYVNAAAGRTTLGEWAGPWMAGRAHLKPSTLAAYDSLLRTRILPTWGTTPLSRVTHSGVVAWLASMGAEGLSPSRTRQAFHLLGAMLDDAVRDGRLARNPAAGVDLPRLPKLERRYLSHDQVAELAGGCGPYGTLVEVLAYCGLRWGEAAALRVRRVDLLRGRLDVVEAVADVGGQLHFGSPKTHAARSVPVPRFLRDKLAEQLTGKSLDGLVFSSPRGDVLRVQNFRRSVFDPAARRAGLDGLVPHSLRHTAASLAISAGASVKGVQAMLGHASAAMTLDRYAHLWGDELDAVADRLDAARGPHVPHMRPTRSIADPSERRPTP